MNCFFFVFMFVVENKSVIEKCSNQNTMCTYDIEFDDGDELDISQFIKFLLGN